MIGSEHDNPDLRDTVNAKIREGHDRIQKLNQEIHAYGNINIPYN